MVGYPLTGFVCCSEEGTMQYRSAEGVQNMGFE